MQEFLLMMMMSLRSLSTESERVHGNNYHNCFPDADRYYKQVYYRQFQAEPEAQPGCTQQYSSQVTVADNLQATQDHFRVPAVPEVLLDVYLVLSDSV